MIATIGLPGSNTFLWTRVADSDEADEWRAAWLGDQGEATQQDLNAVRQGLLLTEREALRARWRDGTRIYASPGQYPGAPAEIACQDWRQELAEHRKARAEWLASVAS